MSIENEIFRLQFEDFLWIVFIVLACLNIWGDYDDRLFLRSNNSFYKEESNRIFNFTLFITFLIYLYFFIRNYKKYMEVNNYQKKLYSVKLFGSIFLIVGVICLLYFQSHQNSFVGSPAI